MAWTGAGRFQLIGDREHRKIKVSVWVDSSQSCTFSSWYGRSFQRWQHTLTNEKGSCICLWKQDLSTEIRQLKDQLISTSIERQKSACSTRQGRTEVRPQRVITEQPPHLVSFHLFLNHTENLLTQRAIQVHSQHLALENTWMRSNALVCLFPFHLAGTRNPSRWAPSQPSAHRSGSHHRGCF